jgi:peptidoglycan/LPS O-acetylase OafA/YrhL
MAAITSATLPSVIWNAALFGLKLGTAMNPPAWSLAVEIQFYAVAPILFALVANRAAFFIILTLGVGAWVAFALGWTETFLSTFILPFALGAYYAQRPRHDWMLRLAPISLAAVILLGVGAEIVRPSPSLGPSTSRFVVMLLSLVSLPYVAASLAKKSDPVDRKLGDLAYPIYLFHWPMFLVATKVSPEHRIWAALTLTLAISFALFWLVDRPLEAWRHAFVSRRAANPNAKSFSDTTT